MSKVLDSSGLRGSFLPTKHWLYRRALSQLQLQNSAATLAQFERKLCSELARKGLSFHFRLYIADEWFCPDGSCTIAVPFYLFHPELMAIEKTQTGQVEGRNRKQQFKYLRHELGHCIDNAYKLRQSDLRQRVFGDSRTPYPASYRPRQHSRQFVDYLGDGYAQSHPDEDFAETFAVWLDPNIAEKKRYRGTPAAVKLAAMTTIMSELKGQTQALDSVRRVAAIERQHHSLAEHYRRRRLARGAYHNRQLEREILRHFDRDNRRGSCQSVVSFLQRERKTLSQLVAGRVQAYHYEVQWAIDRTIAEAQRLGVKGTKAQLSVKAPLLIERNFRYLKEKQQLKLYL